MHLGEEAGVPAANPLVLGFGGGLWFWEKGQGNRKGNICGIWGWAGPVF
jgi:hypothetical protein